MEIKPQKKAATASASQSDPTDRSSVRSVERALTLLGSFSLGSPVLTLSELAQIADLPVSTTSRLLTTLEASGFVRRLPNGYACGIRLFQIGLNALQSLPVYDLAEPHLRELTKATGESAYLAIPAEPSEFVYVRQSLSPKAIKHSVWLGRAIKAGGTAIGAAIKGDVGPGDFIATRSTVEPDVTAIAAPIYSPDGSIVAGINVVGPSFRISDADIKTYGRALIKTTTAVSRELGASLSPTLRSPTFSPPRSTGLSNG